MSSADAQTMVQEYVDAFGARDLARCLDMYDEQATLEFGMATYKGKKALEDWHRARFAAELQLTRIDAFQVDRDTVTVAGAITSKRIKAWGLNTLAGHVVFKVQDGKIVDVRFRARASPLLGFFHS